MTVIAKPKKAAASRAHTTGNKAAAGKFEAPVAEDLAGRDVLVPLDRLFISEANVRKVHHAEGIVELAALIEAEGTLLELLAYCTARSIDAVTGRERSHDQSDAIAEALGVDMADWWVPNAANYLGSVSKAKALEAVKEATGIDATKTVAGMKKPDAVAHCASQLEGSRWLPAPLRARSAQLLTPEVNA